MQTTDRGFTGIRIPGRCSSPAKPYCVMISGPINKVGNQVEIAGT